MPRLLFVLFLFVSAASAQTAPNVDLNVRDAPAEVSTFDLVLPNHPGRLTIVAPNFTVTEASAKPSGEEFGLRGDNKATSAEFLAFLFLFVDETPKSASTDSERCRESMLRHEKVSSLRLAMADDVAPRSRSPIALAEYKQGDYHYVRAFAAEGLLCADVSIYNKAPITSTTPEVKPILAGLTFDPDGQAGFKDLNYYATVLFHHKDPKSAAPIYAKALTMIPADDPDHKWLRYTTDQAVMSYGMAGDLKQSRAIAQHAIELDPDYPLNYYNLACADAEEGNAVAARAHLEQAFVLKANVIQGEHLPDPTEDDSILKLKGDKAFWSFVEGLPRN